MKTNIVMSKMDERVCNTCSETLPITDGVQKGWYCCDEYYCSQKCLDSSFDGSGTSWKEHYDDDGECYYTEWEE